MSEYTSNNSEYSSPAVSESVKYESSNQASYRCRKTCQMYGVCTCK